MRPTEPVPADLTAPTPRERFDVHSNDGTRLHVELHGQETGPTLVLVHGWTCSVRFWSRQLHALSHEARVVVYDQRGHGDSDRPGPAGCTPQALADDLASVLEACTEPGERAIVAGHSMGAMTLIAFGARHPDLLADRVGAAVLANTGMHELVSRSRIVPMPLPLAKLALPVSKRVFGLHPPGRGHGTVLRAAVHYASLSRSATAAEVDFCARLVAACDPRTRTAFARMLADLDLDTEVASFDVPTVVVAGGQDRLTPVWHARRMAEALPRRISMVEVDGAGHMVPVQAAAQFDAVLRRLLADHAVAAEDAPTAGAQRRDIA